jgi:hypothetical protein
VIVAVAVLSAALTTTTPSRFQLEAARDRTPPTAETATTGTGATAEQSTAVTKDATLEVRFEDGSRGSLHLIGPDGIAPGAEVTMRLGIVDEDGSTLDAEQVEYAFIDTDGGTGTTGTMTTGTVNQVETVIPGPGTWRILFTVTRGFTETIGEASLTVEGNP